MSDDTLRDIDPAFIAGTAPIAATKRAAVASVGSQIAPPSPTAITMPAILASVVVDLERSLEAFRAVFPARGLGPLQPTDLELLVNSATALKHIVEEAAGALGMLARAGIKPLEPQP